MKHVRLVSKYPQPANIDLNAIINTKVESKETFVNEKATLFQ